MNDIVIDVKGLTKLYTVNGDQTIFALKNVNFKIKKGERWGIIGKNGSGKSTLLKILSSIIKPSSGTVALYGKVCHILSVGDNFIGELTGKENTYNYFRLNGMNKFQAMEATERAEEFAEIGSFFTMPVKTYSDGMYLRVAYAASLQLTADIILLDEVFSAGDAAFHEKIKQHATHQIAKSETILRVSHNPEEILANCSHCIWLENGTIRMIETVKEVESAYYYQMEKQNREKGLNSYMKEVSTKPETFFMPFGNEYINVTNIVITAPPNCDIITYESGAQISIDFEKKQAGVTLHAAVSIYNYMMNPIMMLIPNGYSEANKIIMSNHDTIGRMRFTTLLPSELLTPGFYYVHVSFSKDVSKGEFIESALNMDKKIPFEIKKESTIDYLDRSTGGFFVIPKCDWTIEVLS